MDILQEKLTAGGIQLKDNTYALAFTMQLEEDNYMMASRCSKHKQFFLLKKTKLFRTISFWSAGLHIFIVVGFIVLRLGGGLVQDSSQSYVCLYILECGEKELRRAISINTHFQS